MKNYYGYAKPKAKKKNQLIPLIVILTIYVSLAIWCIGYTWFMNTNHGGMAPDKWKMLIVMFIIMLSLGSFGGATYSLFIGRHNKLLWLRIVNIVFDLVWISIGLIAVFGLMGFMTYNGGQDYGDLLMRPMNNMIANWSLIPVSLILCIPCTLSVGFNKKVNASTATRDLTR